MSTYLIEAILSIVAGISLSSLLPLISKLIGRSNRKRSKPITNFLDLAILSIENIVPGNLRAYVMVIDERKRNISVKYQSTSARDSGDLQIKLEKWQGGSGEAWGREASVISVYPEISGGFPSWGLSTEHVQLMSNLKAFISIPIISHKNNKIIGILNIDSDADFTDSIKQEDIYELLGTVASSIGYLLEN